MGFCSLIHSLLCTQYMQQIMKIQQTSANFINFANIQQLADFLRKNVCNTNTIH